MPTTKHLEWFDITDFTPGLHGEVADETVDKRLQMPPNAAVVLNNAYPLKTGGLRAAFRATTISASGIDTIANEIATGIGQHSSLANRNGVGNSPDRYLTTLDVVAGQEKIYRMDGTAGATTWSQESGYDRTDANILTAGEVTMFPFIDIDGVRWMVIVLRSGNEPGFYKIKYEAGDPAPAGDGVITKINTWFGPAVANQARVIIAESASSDTLQWTDEGTLDPAIEELRIAPYQDGAEIRGIVPMEPSDLLIGRELAPWVNIQGDITDARTPVREMGQVHTLGTEIQHPARTPDGVAFIDGGGRIYLTDGRQFQSISHMLPPFYRSESLAIRSHGRMAFANHFLFAPGGYVRDWETGAWFTLGEVSTDTDKAMFWLYDAAERKVWCATGGQNFFLREYRPFDTAQEERINSFTWRSAPWARADGRDTHIREVQVFLVAYANSDVSVKRIDADGTESTHTVTAISSGKQMVSFLFPNTGAEYQSIEVSSAADSSSNEAPTIERLRVGMTLPGNRRY